MGLSDADIKHNTPIIVPYLKMMLQTDGAIMTGAIYAWGGLGDILVLGR